MNRAVEAAHRAFAEGPWAKTTPSERGRYLRKLADLLAERSEAPRPHRDRRHRQDVEGDPLAGQVHRRVLPLQRRPGRQGGGRDPADRQAGPLRLHDPRAARGGGRHRAVELPALPGGGEARAGARGRQHGGPQGLGARLGGHAGVRQADRARRAFPPGVVNIVTGFGEPCGRALTSHPLVARVSFTGGPETARHIVRNSAENFAEVSLELGGKSPVMVFEDADLEERGQRRHGRASSAPAASPASPARGSICRRASPTASSTTWSAGPRRSASAIPWPRRPRWARSPPKASSTRIEAEVAKALDQGAVLRHGGKQPAHLNAGWYYEPTILECPAQETAIVDTELFGPVLSVLRFKTEDEVVKLANDTKYGLACGIFTGDGGRALRLSKATRAGIVWVNTYRVVSPIAEFGGFKDSGYGRESGAQAIYDYTRPKTVWINTSPEPIADPFVMR